MTAQSFLSIPDTISVEAQEFLATLPDPAEAPPSPEPDDFAGWQRARADSAELFAEANDEVEQRYCPDIEELSIAGVPVLDIRPRGWQDDGRLVVHAHGGAYTLESARSTRCSTVPFAHDTGLRVLSIDYTLAPEAKWRQVLDEVTGVVTAVVNSGTPWQRIALYGESAGGSLIAGAILRMRDEGFGMPAAVVLWSPWSDIADRGDSAETLKHAEFCYHYDRHLASCALAYADRSDWSHPYVSPVYGDYQPGFPPTLIQGGTKEIFLSHCVRLYQAMDRAGVEAKLDLYDGMVHVFQAYAPELPESRLARRKVNQFFEQKLARQRNS